MDQRGCGMAFARAVPADMAGVEVWVDTLGNVSAEAFRYSPTTGRKQPVTRLFEVDLDVLGAVQRDPTLLGVAPGERATFTRDVRQ